MATIPAFMPTVSLCESVAVGADCLAIGRRSAMCLLGRHVGLRHWLAVLLTLRVQHLHNTLTPFVLFLCQLISGCLVELNTTVNVSVWQYVAKLPQDITDDNTAWIPLARFIEAHNNSVVVQDSQDLIHHLADRGVPKRLVRVPTFDWIKPNLAMVTA